jgi:hypothetical protein
MHEALIEAGDIGLRGIDKEHSKLLYKMKNLSFETDGKTIEEQVSEFLEQDQDNSFVQCADISKIEIKKYGRLDKLMWADSALASMLHIFGRVFSCQHPTQNFPSFWNISASLISHLSQRSSISWAFSIILLKKLAESCSSAIVDSFGAGFLSEIIPYLNPTWMPCLPR